METFLWLWCNRYWHPQIKISLGRCFLKHKNQKQFKKLWWWLQYGSSIWQALGWHHRWLGYISQRKYHPLKQRLGTILSTYWYTHWWCKIQDLIKQNRNCHKYHHSQNYWKDWVLYSFVGYWLGRSNSLNHKYQTYGDSGRSWLPHSMLSLKW